MTWKKSPKNKNQLPKQVLTILDLWDFYYTVGLSKVTRNRSATSHVAVLFSIYQQAPVGFLRSPLVYSVRPVCNFTGLNFEKGSLVSTHCEPLSLPS